MKRDASFAEGRETPLRLIAHGPDDLAVISALVQDAVLRVADISWQPRRREIDILLNRFRWEDSGFAERQNRPFERVRAVLTIRGALALRSDGLDPKAGETVLSLLALSFEASGDGAGRLRLTFAGDGEMAAEVECLDVSLTDVTRPYGAPSGRRPTHPDT